MALAEIDRAMAAGVRFGCVLAEQARRLPPCGACEPASVRARNPLARRRADLFREHHYHPDQHIEHRTRGLRQIGAWLVDQFQQPRQVSVSYWTSF